MEVWKSTDGISIEQGKYAVDILKRFGMMVCKAIATPMASNLKLLSDASLESVDAMMYSQMIGSLMYLGPTFRPKIRRSYCRIFDISLSHVRHYDFF